MGPAVRALMTMVLLISAKGMSGYMRVCYYTNWAQYRNDANFFPENIAASLCTHIFYAFGKLTSNTLKAIEWNDDDDGDRKGMYTRIMSLKTENPSMKILLSIGGWIDDNEDKRTEEFRYTANSATNRAEFITNAIQFLRQRNFDGLDIDWEYPRPEDQHLELMRDLKIAFIREGLSSKREPLLLAAAVYGNAKESVNRYRMGELGLYMDIIGIMSYDYYGSWGTTVKQHSILYPNSTDAVNLWLSNYFPAEKLVLGIATYGRSFRLSDQGSNTPGSNAAGAGTAGLSTKAPGFLSYFEICTKIQKDGWTEVWDPENEVPYAYSGDQWVGYDNEESVEIKAKYVIGKGLGGVMVWTLDFDDFDNRCGGGLYPLISVLNNTLPSGGCNSDLNITGFVRPETQSTTTATTTLTTTAATTTSTTAASTNSQGGEDSSSTLTGEEVDCTDSSTASKLHPVPNDCTKYIQCNPPAKFKMNCGTGLLFSPKNQACDWPSSVKSERTDCP